MTAVKLTTKDLIRAFDVTAMTVSNWRAGSPTKAALPCKKVGRNVVFSAAQVQQWAKRHDVPILDPKALAGDAERGRPGPKPRPARKTH